MRVFPVCLLVLLAIALPQRSDGASSNVTYLTQTVRSSRQDYNGLQGSFFTSFTATGLRTPNWDLRASLSWVSWRDDGTGLTAADVSGPGSVFLSAGKKFWESRSGGNSVATWLRLKGKLPLQGEYDATGSGEFDWGWSLYTSFRLGAVSAITEFGRLDLGSPAGFDFGSATSISAFLSYGKLGTSLFPLVGYTRSSSLLPDDPPFAEWSLGLGALVSSGLSLSALYSSGTTEISPASSISISAWIRI